MTIHIEPEAMKLRDFLKRYGISRSAAFEHMAAGRLKARRLGAHLLITKHDADEWLASLPARSPKREAA
ncbi:helix-turn-helix domain-containing protein [Bosea beijingensis]